MRWYFLITFVPAVCLTGPSLWAEPNPGANNPAIALNTVGYLPKSRKVGTTSKKVLEFVVRDIQTGEVVLRGNASPESAPGAAPAKYMLDFSAVHREGKYRMETGDQSAKFDVAADVYNWPFYCVTRGLYLSRCGTSVSATVNGHRFEHSPCHLDDAYLDFVGGPAGTRRDGTGGWHDAGDYNKYTVNAAFTLGVMLTAWDHFRQNLAALELDIPESHDRVPDFLDEAKWELEWLLKMQVEDGSVHHKLSTRKFGGLILPEIEMDRRYFSPWGSAATAAFVAVMAQSARVYQEFDKPFSGRCLAAAQRGYEFLQSHPDDHRPDLKAFAMGPYVAADPDDRLWAAAEFWETTGDAGALVDCEARLAGSTVDIDWDWANLRNLGAFTYLRSKRVGRSATSVARVRDNAVRAADSIVESAARHPYGRPLGEKYYWGCNGTVARQAMNLNVAYELTRDRRYRETMHDALNHLFGRNPYGRSYVTGLGLRPPMFPHDRRSGGDTIDAPWPGYLVGGPWPGPNDWVDNQDSYQTNEIAINWNGALIYALAAFVDPTTFDASIKSQRERTEERSAN